MLSLHGEDVFSHIRRNMVMPLKGNRKKFHSHNTTYSSKGCCHMHFSVSGIVGTEAGQPWKIVCLRGPWLLIESLPWFPTALPCEDNPWGKVLLHLNETSLAHYLFRQTTSTNDSSFPYFVLPVRQPSTFTSQLIIKE